MSDHRYTIQEIDRMRELLKMLYPLQERRYSAGPYFGPDPAQVYADEVRNWTRYIEERLRTCMIGGVRPEELEASLKSREA